MTLLNFPLLLAAAGIIFVLHFAASFTHGILSKCISFANIALHICLFILFLVFNIPIDEVVMIFVVSLFCLVLSAYIEDKLFGADKEGDK